MRDAAWQPDPWQRHEFRYWDGERWTEHVADDGVQGTDEPGGELPPPVAPRADNGTDGLLRDVGGVAVASKIRDKKLSKVMDGAALAEGETARLVVRATRLRAPAADSLVITNARLIVLDPMHSVTFQATSGDLDSVSAVPRSGLKNPRVEIQAGQRSLELPLIDDLEDVVAQAAARLMEEEPPRAVLDAIAADQAETSGAESTPDDNWFVDVDLHGSRMNTPTAQAIRELSDEEKPWFVVVTGTSGTLAAWSDRLAIIKAGGMTAVMAGAAFGARIATFHFVDITGLEYNAGLATGVLEVLTASYQGTANKDYWQGTLRGRNEDAKDPWTLSNTLPMPKAMYRQLTPQLNELRRRIAEAKRPQVHVHSESIGTSPALADHLKDLASLHKVGALTDEEFTAAKSRLISGDSP